MCTIQSELSILGVRKFIRLTENRVSYINLLISPADTFPYNIISYYILYCFGCARVRPTQRNAPERTHQTHVNNPRRRRVGGGRLAQGLGSPAPMTSALAEQGSHQS